MSEVLFKEREIVVPGQILADGMDYLPGDNTYRENDKIYSKLLGLISLAGRVVKITPLSGPYVPKVGDKIIAKVIDIAMSGWRVETGTAYSAMMNIKDASARYIKREEDLSQILDIGDDVVVVITKVTSQKLIDVTMKEPGLRKITGGRIIKINSNKVPRVIGKKGSMISMLKTNTGCEITVGQNGLVWIKGTPEGELKTAKAIKQIAENAHQSGLTEKMETFLKGEQ
jgi:exosome complex component RRP4